MNRINDSQVRALILFSVTVLSRLPFRTNFLYSQDSVQFALATEKYDVYLHQPHPPGYFLYVMLGRLVHYFVQNANTSFVFISIVSSGLAVVIIYWLGRAVFNETVGWWAGLLAVTSPLLWFYGEVALNYSVAAFFISWIAWLCWQSLKNHHNRIYLSAILLGVGAGIRQEILMFMFPLWLYCFSSCGWRKVVTAVALLSVTVGSWFVPMLIVSGGPERYFLSVHELWKFHNSRLAIWNAGITSRLDTLLSILGFISYGVGIGALFIFFGFYVFLRTGAWRKIEKDKLIFFILWFLPGILFYLLIFLHPYNHGHGLYFLPAVLVLLPCSVEYVLSEFKRIGRLINSASDYMVSLTLAVLVAVNASVYCLMDVSYSVKSVREHDRDLSTMLAGIKQAFPSDSTVLLDLRASLFYGYRHIQYYLPDYKVYLADLRVNEGGEKWHIFGGINGQTVLFDALKIPPDTKYVIYLMDPSDDQFKRELRQHNSLTLILENHMVLYYQDLKRNL